MFSSDEEEEDGQPTFSMQGHQCLFADPSLKPLKVDVLRLKEVECEKVPEKKPNELRVESGSKRKDLNNTSSRQEEA